MSDEETLKIANEIAGRHGLKAEFPPGIRSVGVGGDARNYTLVIILTGQPVSHEVLAEASTEISNLAGVMRVLIETASLENRLKKGLYFKSQNPFPGGCFYPSVTRLRDTQQGRVLFC